MTRSSNSLTRQNWQARINAQASSGLGVAQFCEQQGCSPGSFYQWKRKLAPPKLASSNEVVSQAATHQNAFQQLVTRRPLTHAAWIELSLPGGTVARIPADQLEALELILRLAAANS